MAGGMGVVWRDGPSGCLSEEEENILIVYDGIYLIRINCNICFRRKREFIFNKPNEFNECAWDGKAPLDGGNARSSPEPKRIRVERKRPLQ